MVVFFLREAMTIQSKSGIFLTKYAWGPWKVIRLASLTLLTTIRRKFYSAAVKMARSKLGILKEKSA